MRCNFPKLFAKFRKLSINLIVILEPPILIYLLIFLCRCSYENCQFETKYPKSLKSHVKDQHTGGTTKRTHRSEDSKSIVHCVECGKTYKKWYYQQVHISTCGNQSTLSCEICHQVCGYCIL